MSDRVAAQTQQTADVGRRLEMHAHEILIGDRGYDSDRLDDTLMTTYGIEMIAAHRRGRARTQDGRPLRRVRRRWKVERFFAWLHHSRRAVTRWEYHVCAHAAPPIYEIGSSLKTERFSRRWFGQSTPDQILANDSRIAAEYLGLVDKDDIERNITEVDPPASVSRHVCCSYWTTTMQNSALTRGY